MAHSTFFTADELKDILAHFQIDSLEGPIVRYGNGHINDTFLFSGEKRYILQRINTAIFSAPEKVMSNILGVTKALSEKIKEEGGDPERETLRVIFTKDGQPFLSTPQHDAWRVYPFIENTLSLEQPSSEEDFRQSAYAFGHFQYLLKDYPAASLFETIPHFHDTPKRYQDFLGTLAKDSAGRKSGVLREISFVQERSATLDVIQRGLKEGRLPLRVTHNDTKLNNVLLDAKTRKGLCVIDLDTIMPGSALYDFGDSIRFGANTAKEDEKDLSKVSFSLPLFRAYMEGFLSGCHGALTEEEISLLPESARLLTLECGIRFLSDYLGGDTYFKIAYPDHNLVRARTQFALVEDIERRSDELKRIVSEVKKEKNL
jgi:Ser/Thr protein kinase RdoA (MazF antagonist)